MANINSAETSITYAIHNPTTHSIIGVVDKEIRKKQTNKVSVNPTTKIPGNFYIEKNGSTKMIYIKKVLYNNPVTVVWWNDGTVTRNRCPENVTYNPDTGLLFCITKRLLGNNDVAEIFNAWSLPENEEANNAYVTLKDVRKTLREEGKLD